MADTASLVVRVKSTGVDKTSGELDKLHRVSKVAATSAAALAAAVVAGSAAIVNMAVKSAQANAELENLARQAKLSTGAFKALEFATKKYGVTGEQIADISKDLSDKLGEFATAATGPFQDFVDVMGMTKAQGVELAKELQNLSGDQVVGALVSRMEAAGASANQMTFVLESMGNDLSKLVPLFSNNSAELGKLTSRFDDINKSMEITSTQAEDLKELSSSWDLLASSVGTASTSISATVAPVITEFFNDVISIVPQAEQAIVDFLNRFIEVDNLNSIEAVNTEFERQKGIMEANQWAQDALAKKTILVGRAQDQQITALNAYNEAQERAEQLIFQRLELEEKMRNSKLADARIGQGTTGGEAKKVALKEQAESDAPRKQAEAYLEQLRQANLTEMQLIDTQEQEKKTKLQEYKDLNLISEQQYQDALTEIQTTAVLSRAEIQNAILDEQSRIADESRKQQIADAAAAEAAMLSSSAAAAASLGDITSALQSAGKEQSAAYKVLFAAQKAAAIPSMITATEEGATKALSLGPIAGPIAAGAIKALGYASIGVVAGQAITGAREQGGYMTGGSAYQMAERGKAEVIVPAGNSRAKTISQMNDMMGGNSGSTSVVIVNQTTGRIDSAESDRDDEGRIRIIIREEVSSGLLNQDSQIAKARRSTRGQAGY